MVILYQTYLVKGSQRMFTVAWLVAGFTELLRKDIVTVKCRRKIKLGMPWLLVL